MVNPETPDRRTAKRWIRWILNGVAAALLLLAVSLVPSRGCVFINNHERQHKVVMKDLLIALGHFHTEYNRYPVPVERDSIVRSQGVLITSVLGMNEQANPRHILFVEFPMAREGRLGLTGVPEEREPAPSDLKLVDRWGEMFYVALDVDGDSEVANPEVSADAAWLKQHPQPATLKIQTAVFSAGPDRDPKTWRDNIASWR